MTLSQTLPTAKRISIASVSKTKVKNKHFRKNICQNCRQGAQEKVSTSHTTGFFNIFSKTLFSKSNLRAVDLDDPYRALSLK